MTSGHHLSGFIQACEKMRAPVMDRQTRLVGAISLCVLPLAAAFSPPAAPSGLALRHGGAMSLHSASGRGVAASPLSVLGMSTAAPVATGGNGDGEEEADTSREWPSVESRSKDYSLMKGEIAVRFINTPGRFPSTGDNDIIAAAKEGEVLMQVGDTVGVDIPRGCMTGLCGACTSDLEDPSFPGQRSTLRACSARVVLPEGCEEMVIDCYRMLEAKSNPKADPMARFSSLDDPNVGFKARWNMPEAGAASKQDCPACGATGVDAKGMMPEDCVIGKGCPFGKL